jgi:hypothetical protein
MHCTGIRHEASMRIKLRRAHSKQRRLGDDVQRDKEQQQRLELYG